MKLIRQTLLRFQKGTTSDKVYEVDLVETAENYLVNFRYGKYGANLREGSKTKSPVELNEATKIADSLLVSKINKGYWVVSGYDPINKIMVGKQAVDKQVAKKKKTETLSDSERNQRIVDRLEQFSKESSGSVFSSKSDTKNIDGYSLGRTLWKAGELRIKAAVPPIISILKAEKVSKQPIDYYSIMWALGRTADEQVLPLLDKLEKKLPDNTQYMLKEVKMALSSKSEQFITASDIDFPETLIKIDQYDEIEKLSFRSLDDEEKEYTHLVMELHGITAEVETAIKQLIIEDALESEYLSKYLSNRTVEIINKNEAAYPELSDAIERLLENKSNNLINEKSVKYKSDYDLYKSIVEKIDLVAVFDGDTYTARHAELGKLDWIWGEDQKLLRKAIKKTKKVKDVKHLFKQVEKYAELTSDLSHNFTDQEITHFYQITKDAGVFDDVSKVIDQFKLKDSRWYFLNENLSQATRSKCERNIKNLVVQLFQNQFHALRLQALKPKQALLETHQASALDLYGASLSDADLRIQILSVIKNTPVRAPFTQTFRRIYKIAEFRDDAEVLAILNYRIEATSPSPSNYWDDIPKPFSKATKEYFRRRMVRTLRNIAKFQSTSYLQYAKAILLQADDNDKVLKAYSKKSGRIFFPRLAALNFILHENSQSFSKNYLGIWHLKEKRKEVARPEAYPELWDHAEMNYWIYYLLVKHKWSMTLLLTSLVKRSLI